MSKPTGAGKISELSRKGKDSIRRKALLFNFDFDGDQIKDEHKRWLDENIVPLMGNLNLTFNLRGLASRSGSAEYNKKLSERRVASVKQYLVSKGGKFNQFQTFGAGEADAEVAGQADGKEDEAFRGVVVTVGSTARDNTARFEQVFPTDKENGFDANAEWLMIPYEKPVREIRVVNAAGFRIESRDLLIATPFQFTRPQIITRINSDDEVIRIRGNLPGATFLLILDSDDMVVASLEIAVLQKLQVTTAFHFLRHPMAGTRRRLGEEVDMLKVMNTIYMRQANIEFVKLSARDLRLSDPFGIEINERARLGAGKMEWNALTENRDPNARFNVFLVREVERVAAEGQGDTVNALTALGGVDGVMEDDTSPNPSAGQCLAHEVGHALGVEHDAPIKSSKEMLMFGVADRIGRFLPKIHVDLMRSKVANSI